MKTNQFKRTRTSNCGYTQIGLYSSFEHKTISCFVHRLVAQAFIPNKLNKEQVNHIDGNKNNNTISNLEWSTRSENVKHAYLIGIKEPTEKVRAVAQKLRAVPVAVTNKKTREEMVFYSGRRAANYFNVKPHYFYKLLRTNGEDSNFAIKKLRGESNV